MVELTVEGEYYQGNEGDYVVIDNGQVWIMSAGAFVDEYQPVKPVQAGGNGSSSSIREAIKDMTFDECSSIRRSITSATENARA
jgi:hypothetical protein